MKNTVFKPLIFASFFLMLSCAHQGERGPSSTKEVCKSNPEYSNFLRSKIQIGEKVRITKGLSKSYHDVDTTDKSTGIKTYVFHLYSRVEGPPISISFPIQKGRYIKISKGTEFTVVESNESGLRIRSPSGRSYKLRCESPYGWVNSPCTYDALLIEGDKHKQFGLTKSIKKMPPKESCEKLELQEINYEAPADSEEAPVEI